MSEEIWKRRASRWRALAKARREQVRELEIIRVESGNALVDAAHNFGSLILRNEQLAYERDRARELRDSCEAQFLHALSRIAELESKLPNSEPKPETIPFEPNTSGNGNNDQAPTARNPLPQVQEARESDGGRVSGLRLRPQAQRREKHMTQEEKNEREEIFKELDIWTKAASEYRKALQVCVEWLDGDEMADEERVQFIKAVLSGRQDALNRLRAGLTPD